MTCPVCDRADALRAHCRPPLANCHWAVCFGCGVIVSLQTGRCISARKP
jgi:hypothetical protein